MIVISATVKRQHFSMSNKVRRMLVLLLIILREAGPTAACSSNCSADCDCSRRGLTSVPQYLPTNIIWLDLERNVIATLSQSDFSRYKSLTRLVLQANQISMIHNKTFHNLTSLTLLDLSSNELTNLTPGVFVGLGNLLTLWLPGNLLTSLSAEVFAGLGNLRKLYLHYNYLTTLPGDVFAGLGNLWTLHLYVNRLETLPPSAYDMLASISNVYIEMNPWQCDCRMAPFRQRMKGSYQFEEDIICARPLNLREKRLLDVNPEDLICEETTPVYSTSSTKHMADSSFTSFIVQSTMTGSNTPGPANGGIVLSVSQLATLCVFLGLFIICNIGLIWCMYKRRQNPTGTSSCNDQIGQHAAGTIAYTLVSSQSETPHPDTEDTQHIYNLPTDDDPDTAEYNTIDEVDQSESPHDVVSPSQRSQPGSEQMQHLGSFNDGYEVPSPSLCPKEGPQSHKYVNSHMTAAAKDAAAGPQVMVYENEDEIESAKEASKVHSPTHM